MDLTEATEIVSLLQAAWPNYGWRKGTNAAYHLGLSDLPCEAVKAAVVTAIRTRPFCPTPAELRAIAIEPLTDQVPSVEAAWGEVTEQLLRTSCAQVPTFSHPLIAQAVRILGWESICMSETPGVERKHFRDTYLALREKAVKDITLTPLPEPEHGDALPGQSGPTRDPWPGPLPMQPGGFRRIGDVDPIPDPMDEDMDDRDLLDDGDLGDREASA